MSASAFYEGHIRHRRFAVRNHEFRYRVAMAYVDLDELPSLLRGRLTRSAPGLVRFRRRDYLGDPTTPLDRRSARWFRSDSATSPRVRSACSRTSAASATASTR